MKTHQNTTLSTRTLRSYQSELLHNVSLRAPEIGFAARFLPKNQRSALLSVVGLAIILIDILHPIPSFETDSSEEAVSETSASGEGELNEEQSGGCSFGKEGMAIERMIAERIITYLYHEAEPGEIGRPEIELYLQVKDAYPVTEKAWLRLIGELAAYYEPKRFATRRALYTRMDAIVEAGLEVIGPIVFAGDTHWGEECEESGANGNGRGVRSGLVMLGRGVMLTQVLRTLRSEWEGGQRLLVPLDILGEFGLRDSDFTSALENKSGADEGLSARVIRSAVDDAASFFTRGAAVFSAIDGPTGRSALLFGLQWKLILKRVVEAYAKIPADTRTNRAGRIERGRNMSLRRRDRYRLLRPALMLDPRLLDKELSV